MAKAKKTELPNFGVYKPELSLNERIDELHRLAVHTEHVKYERPLTEEELVNAKLNLVSEIFAHDALVDELKEITTEKKIEIKSYADLIEDRKQQISEEILVDTGDLFHIPSEDEKLVYVYSASGHFIRTEPLKVYPMFDGNGDAYPQNDAPDFQ